MPTPTRTIGPLHIEDLEPHRFEDLVRQLAYDFRDWHSIEATGRTGRDEGFDARAWERLSSTQDEENSNESEDAGEGPPPVTMRLWLIQCKREKAIGPAKLATYLEDIPEKERSGIYGVLFVGACDFSKEARDIFRQGCRDFGFSEAHLWGKGELEDLLFQPKNDHLLFAYFGISLQARKRSLKTEVRGRIATKRKASKVFASYQSALLVRDAEDERYPYLDEDKSKSRRERGRWRAFSDAKCAHDGLRVLVGRHFAFIDDDGKHWDYAETHNDARMGIHDDPWTEREEAADPDPQGRGALWDTWEQLPEHNRAWMEVYVVLPYDAILAIDEDGDDFFQKPHVYTVPWIGERGPYGDNYHIEIETIGRFDKRFAAYDEDLRVQTFPRNAKK